jgi:hypothetical protein
MALREGLCHTMAGPFFVGQRSDAKWSFIAAADLAMNVTAKLKEQQKTRRPSDKIFIVTTGAMRRWTFYMHRTCDGVKRWL